MNDTERDLQAALLVDLEDWTTWSVYADWLSERGDRRGEHVRLAHRLATQSLSTRESEALYARAQILEQESQEELAQSWVLPEEASLTWQHGFVTEVQLRWGSDTMALLEDLAARRSTLLSSLDLGFCEVGPDGARALASSRALRTVRLLYLPDAHLGDEGARALAASEQLLAVKNVCLGRNDIGDDGVEALVGASWLRGLSRLDLCDNRVGDRGAQLLAGCEALRGLGELDLTNNPLGDAGVRALRELRGCEILT